MTSLVSESDSGLSLDDGLAFVAAVVDAQRVLLDYPSDAAERFPKLVGRQEAEHFLADIGDQAQAERALTFYGRIKKHEFPWQGGTTRGILAVTDEGLWLHPIVVIIAPRQNGKTLSAADLRIMSGLFVFGEKMVYSAQRWKTAESIFNRINRLVKSRPSLDRRVTRRTCSQGQASFAVQLDPPDDAEEGAEGPISSCEFITRSVDSGRGLDEIDLIIYDEAYNLKDAEIQALSPTQMASSNPQTIYLSSAVDQTIHANGIVLARLRERALASIKAGTGANGLYYAEYMAPEPPEECTDAQRRALREDPATWILANPSYGIIQTQAKVQKLMDELSPRAFEVEVLGWGDWPVVSDTERPIDKDKWANRHDPEPVFFNDFPAAISVSRCPSTRKWSIAGAQYVAAGTVHVEVWFHGQASMTDVAAKLKTVVAFADPSVLVIESRDGAAILVPYLAQHGIEPHLTNATELAVACDGFLEAVDNDQVTHSGQPVLADSMECTIKRDLPGDRFAWEPIPGGSIVATNAVTYAHWGLLSFARPPERVAPPITDAPDRGDTDLGGHETELNEFDALTAAF
jgi:hypothetical protein